MPGYAPTTPRHIRRQVIGWVLVLPLLVSFLRLPFPFGLLLGLGSIAASAYGVWFASRHASRRVTLFALIVTVFNAFSMFMLGTASLLKVPYLIAWYYWYEYHASWVYGYF
ncbi:hypothetical protein Q1J45_11750 [Pseudomonas rhodesiae]|uniref:hypothetical protein n=1 Tax=unclassified Pseudomonas TaxID=196821 RepID=UPI00273540BB|nr:MULTISPECIES: hypothetical protein [unclassified Pseudomonas]WLH42379.1 hypothetical protein PSH94_07360 [Pseudomonas sp. FP2254]